MNYVFGPVPSRRLGQSLGIDTIPLKTCNWNCVYCQLGRTMPLTNERRAYFPSADILAEVKAALANHQPGEIDWVTFVGSGEPTLHSGIGWLIRQVKMLTDLPVAVITNGSLLYLPEVRRDLAEADVVMPSLDAGTAVLYRQLNRPHPEVTFDRLVDGLIAFRREYSGQIWIEVMLMQGLNDTEEALQDIAAVLRRIQPNEVHINLPTRPPAETWVRPSDEAGLLRARAILGDIATIVHPAEGEFDLSGFETAVDAIIAIITRHPMRQEEIERALTQWTPGHVREALADLEASGQAQVVERYGARFWSAAPSHYPDEAHSLAAAPGRHHHHQLKENLMTKDQVKDWMTANVITISGSSTLPDAYWLMLENKIRRLPVLEDGVLVGMVTLEDLRRMDSVQVAGFDVIHISDTLSRLPVRRLMTGDPKTIAPTASLVDAARLMLGNKISALPVLDKGELVGIITESDIFRAFVEAEEQ